MVFLTDQPYFYYADGGQQLPDGIEGQQPRWVESYMQRKMQRYQEMRAARRKQHAATTPKIIQGAKRLRPTGGAGSSQQNLPASAPLPQQPSPPPSRRQPSDTKELRPIRPRPAKAHSRLRGTSSMPMLPPMGGEPSGAAPAEENLWDPSFLAIPKDENVFELRVTPPIPTPPPEVVNLEDMLPGWWDRAERVRPSAQKWEGNHARLASNGQRVEECLRKHPEHLDLTKGLKASTTRVARHRFIAPVLTPRKKKISVDSAFIQRPKDRYQIDLEAILRAEGYLDDDDLSTNTGYSGSRPNSRGDMSRGSDEGDLDGPRRGGRRRIVMDADGNPVMGDDGKPMLAPMDLGEEAEQVADRIEELKKRQAAGELTAEEAAELKQKEGKLQALEELKAAGVTNAAEAKAEAAKARGKVEEMKKRQKEGKLTEEEAAELARLENKLAVLEANEEPRGKKGKKGKGGEEKPKKEKKEKGPVSNGLNGVTAGGWSAMPSVSAEEVAANLGGGEEGFLSVSWGARIEWSDAHALIDTEEVDRQRFENDWKRCTVDLGLGRAIKAATGKGGGRRKEGEPEEEEADPRVDAVKEQMWTFRAACAVVFDFYAAVGASGGSGDLSYITLNIWNNFLLDFSIIDQKSQFLKQSDLDTLFISIDSHAARVQAEHKKEEEEAFKNKALEKKPPPGMLKRQSTGAIDPSMGSSMQVVKAEPKNEARFEDKMSRLSRVEFYCALVKIAIKKYIDTQKLKDVAAAVTRLLERDLIPKLRPAHQPPNNFRLTHLYSPPVETVLRPRLASLRNIFDGLASRSPMMRKYNLISQPFWLSFLRAARLCGVDATDRDATLCFSWSRMVVINELTEIGNLRQENLPFEGFLEALARFAGLKALPTDEQIAAMSSSKAKNAAIWLEDLQMNDTDGYNSFLQKNKCEWGAERKAKSQPLHRQLDHLLDLIYRVLLKDDVAGVEEVSAEAMRRWMEKELDKKEISGQKK